MEKKLALSCTMGPQLGAEVPWHKKTPGAISLNALMISNRLG